MWSACIFLAPGRACRRWRRGVSAARFAFTWCSPRCSPTRRMSSSRYPRRDACGAGAALLIAVQLLWVAGCQRASTTESAPAPPKKAASVTTCRRPVSEAHYDTPQAVYSAYAAAINQTRWCDAIATFEDASTSRIVVVNFKGLALLAGASNPKQPQYAAALKQFCRGHGLDCADASWLATFVPTAMSRGKVDAQLAAVRRHAQEAPFATYVEIMEAMQSVDASAMARLDTTLAAVEERGETATGMAQRAGGKSTKIDFIRTERGWKLSMPDS